jgi:ankyrin repeat protein
LLTNGADVNAKTNKSGETPLDWAFQEHSDAVADLLRAQGPRTSPAPPSAANDDDPIGAGGFISPPSGNSPTK